MQYAKAQVKVTADKTRTCARARDLVLDGLKNCNYSVSPIKESTPSGFHCFINLEFETELAASEIHLSDYMINRRE